MKRIQAHLIVVALLSQLSCAQQSPPSSQAQAQLPSSIQSTLSQLSNTKLPAQLSLFGERVPLEVPEVRERAEREFYLLLQQPAQIILNYKRSGRYFPLMDRILKEQGLPADMRYLAIAESALYMARSPKDAVGIWQFIEGTAKRYGLEVNEFVDERRHVEKSTRAATEFLRDAYKRFSSWTMAAAAYNMGIDGAQFNVDLQGYSNYYDLYFNEETSRYVLRIAIIKEIFENAATYGMNVGAVDVYQPDKTKAVKIYAAIDNLSDWAKSLGYSYKEIKLLNPWILKTSLPKPRNGFWEILTPQK